MEEVRRHLSEGGDGAREPGSVAPTPRHRSLWTLYRDLWRFLAGHRRTILFAIGCLSVATLLKLIPPAATKVVVDYILLDQPLPAEVPETLLPASPLGRLGLVVLAVIVVSVVGTALSVWGRWRATVVAKRLQVRVRRWVFEHAASLPLNRVYQLKSGGLASLLREDAGAPGEMVFNMLYNPWRAVVQLVGGILVLALVDWRFLIAVVTLGPIAYGADRLWSLILRPIYRASRRQRQEINATCTETFAGMRVVRAFGRLKTEAARFVAQSHLLTRLEMWAWYRARAFDIFWELLMPTASSILLFYGGWQVLNGSMTPGDLMMFLVYLAMLLEPIAVLASNMTALQNNLSGFDRVLDLLDEPREMADSPGTIRIAKPEARGRVSVEGVSFRYPGMTDWVLREIDLEVEPGETIALVGRSGAGKTTLCNLIARFFDPTVGTIRLDGLDLRTIQLQSYRRLLGIVEQDVFLFDGSVAENIAYAAPKTSREAVRRAAEAANASGFIEALPDGYETLIGERGVRLSGGQRQRLAIARAILADPVLFILDEATSNLDTESEQLIQAALDDLLRNRTSFVIAHRLSTIRNADRILVLEAGEVVELGPHEELIERSGRYRDMVELQRLEGLV